MYVIRFKNQGLRALRTRLLDDLSREYWAILLGKMEHTNGIKVLKVHEILYPSASDYVEQHGAFLRLRRDFVHRALTELQSREDLDTIIDVHTHPFSRALVSFSGTDDADEMGFREFLEQYFDDLVYGSIVLSQTQYSARVWEVREGVCTPVDAVIKTQTLPEQVPCSRQWKSRGRESEEDIWFSENGMLNRQVSVLGLDVMRQITASQRIVIAGVGGLGSVVAEHLVHMGFQDLVLIDPDVLEVSNLNRIVGASHDDAVRQIAKVHAIANHLRRINPVANVVELQQDINDPDIESYVATADWLIVATDSHASRHRAQALSIKYFVPLIAVGVNIRVAEEAVEDMSGEVITARIGDNLCLHCLGRINFIKMASEVHAEELVRTELVRRGYVEGRDVHEPAVKTLNTMLATMAVDTLINQYTEYQRHVPILVYENNATKCIYEDKESVAQRNKQCFTCCL